MKKIKKSKSKKQTKPRAKVKKYESHYLALALVAVLLFEGFVGTSTTLVDWQKGLSVLDMSSHVQQTSTDLVVMMTPIGDSYLGVEEFYSQAADHMALLLDLSDKNPVDDIAFVTGSVNEFYQQASNEMIALLDFSSTSSWPAQVAGVSIEVR